MKIGKNNAYFYSILLIIKFTLGLQSKSKYVFIFSSMVWWAKWYAKLSSESEIITQQSRNLC